MANENLGNIPKLMITHMNKELQTALSKEIMEAVIKDIITIAAPFIRDAVEKVSVRSIEMGRDAEYMRDEYRVTYLLGDK